MDLTSFAAGCFGISSLLVLYAYIGYPALVWVLARVFSRRRPAPAPQGDGQLPTVSLLLAAYNEESVIEERLRDALAMDYPREKFEILVGCDGCTDRTAEVVRRFGDRVRLLDFVHNRGKASVLNSAVAEASGEILMFSDANTATAPEAARRLVRWFQEPQVGSVVGRLVLTDPRTGRNADGLYWKYETFLKRCEGRLGALLGANGAIYALRRELFTPIPAGTIVDDFVIPLLAKQRTGCDIVYDCEAVALEETPPDVRSEFRRRARIGAGGFQSITMLWRLLDPRRGWVAFTFLSHKILRWLCPFFLITALVSSLVLWDRPLYRALFLAQAAFYTMSIVMACWPAHSRLPKLLRLPTMFTSMNAALFVGFWAWLSGRQKGTWKRTARAGESGGTVR